MSIHTFHLDGHRILFRPADKRLFILNSAAGWIWQAVAEGFSLTEIADQLAAHFRISRQVARRDIAAQLNQWAVLGLNPCLAEPEQERPSAPAVQPPRPDNKLFPGDTPYSLQHNFHFGSADITLTDYTSDLASHFAPLLSGLPALDTKKSTTQIILFKDADKYVISCNRIELERTRLELVAVGRVIQAIIEFGYPQTTWMAFIHASAGSLDGHGIVFPGTGGSGKSTLMAALAKSGWIYWCDDTVPLDTQGQAGAVPLSPCLKSGSWEILAPFYPVLTALPIYQRCGKDVRYLPSEDDRADFSSTLPVHALVFPEYGPDRTQKLRSLQPVEGLQRLIDAQSWISPDPDRTGEMIRWIRTIPTYSLQYHSLDWAIARLEQLVRNGRL